MSWVARALPANSTSTNPASTSATIGGIRAGVHDRRAGDPEHPAAVTLHVADAGGDLAHLQRLRLLRRDHRGHEAEHALPAAARCARSVPAAGSTTRTPDAPQTIWSPSRTSETGTVRTRAPVTSSPQSISGCSTGTQEPPSRTTVSRLVVE